ncbi:protein REVEILLE 4-like isoform X1 [Humulus lupulus]|uniref:protein REVEILLE 4-like isoform X1 n=1 Tax=Humulus lupulus TaxID=3486 RepID=UPI002B411CCB|nr:protein REVEILLE 4-like isoform X1 [Humulus lupulus]
MCMGLPGTSSMPPPANSTPSSTAAAANTTLLGVPPNKKIRKTYTITKTRQSWTEQEHEKFVEGVQLFNRDWKKIEAFIGSKTVIQIRSHAQKYFEKILKSGKSELVPPPRPKKKAAHPYPHKAPNNAPNVAHVTAVIGAPTTCVNPITDPPLAPWRCSSVLPINFAQIEKDDGRLFVPTIPTIANNSGYSSEINDPIYTQAMRVANNSRYDVTETESSLRSVPSSEIYNPGAYYSQGIKVVPEPDISQLYNFIGNIFDPYEVGHSQKRRQMDPLNFKSALWMMTNLSNNLKSPMVEELYKFLSSNNLNEEKVMPSACPNNFSSIS